MKGKDTLEFGTVTLLIPRTSAMQQVVLQGDATQYIKSYYSSVCSSSGSDGMLQVVCTESQDSGASHCSVSCKRQ
eukprot:4941884-Amphidinium_carterae.1